jgi:high-affinity Fe2+/Pb2+ permease
MPLGIAIMFGVMGAAVSAVVFWMAGTVVWMLRNNEV